MTAIEDEKLLTISEVCHQIGVSYKTLWRWQKFNDFPKTIILGHRTRRLREREVSEWLKNREKRS